MFFLHGTSIGNGQQGISYNEEIYEKAFFSTEVPPQNTFERRVALTAMEAARKDEAERCLRFAEWAYTNGWCFVEGEVWINYDESVKPTTNTTSELYQIFKTQTNG